ncbi:LEA_2 domain-containing protein [Senna tora]|uniref:LEA_2 domain-containing protein n=1 Tax=Senna tora TaxID=362788 RepID=A0A834W2R6_9FABA|nr:LEA_2 domain-containing protein [Senna tora]
MTTRANPHPNGVEHRPQPNGDHRPRPPPNGELRPPPNGELRPPPALRAEAAAAAPPSFSSSSHQHHRHYYPPTPYRSSSSASFKGCCCCLFLLFSFLALLVLAIVLVIILAVKPKKPQFDLQQVGVQYMGITPNPPATATATATAVPNDGTTASLSLTIRLLFTAVNPNKVGIKYGESRFTVMYRGIPLGKASVPGFYQEAHSVRQVVATIAVDRVNLLQADAADLIRDASLNDRVELRVLGDVGAKIRVMNFDSPGVQIKPSSGLSSLSSSEKERAVTVGEC